MRRGAFVAVILASASVAACTPDRDEQERAAAVASAIDTYEIDGTRLFVPRRWERHAIAPATNGVATVAAGGWRRFDRALAATGAQGDRNALLRATSAGQEPHPSDPFFRLQIGFSPRGGDAPGDRAAATLDTRDILHLTYHAPQERTQPYHDLLEGLAPGEGEDVGDGWREVVRPFGGRAMRLRWDDRRWREEGGDRPRHLAASYSEHGLWDHHVALDPAGWSASFRTDGLAPPRWRALHGTAVAIARWLETPPTERDETRLFAWPARH